MIPLIFEIQFRFGDKTNCCINSYKKTPLVHISKDPLYAVQQIN